MEDGSSAGQEMTEGTNAGNSTFIPYHLLNITSTLKFMILALLSSNNGCFFSERTEENVSVFCAIVANGCYVRSILSLDHFSLLANSYQSVSCYKGM